MNQNKYGCYVLRLRPIQELLENWREEERSIQTAPGEVPPPEQGGKRYISWSDTEMRERLEDRQMSTFVRTRRPGDTHWLEAPRLLWMLASEALYVGGSNAGVADRVRAHVEANRDAGTHSLAGFRAEFVGVFDGSAGEIEHHYARKLTQRVYKKDGSLRDPEEIAEDGIVAFAPA
jgi:hypothetical protein